MSASLFAVGHRIETLPQTMTLYTDTAEYLEGLRDIRRQQVFQGRTACYRFFTEDT